MRRVTTAAVALATTTALSVGLSVGASAGASAKTPERSTSRDAGLALKAAGYGSRMIGGQLPAGSHQTAYTAIGCGAKVGMSRENHEADGTLPGAGTVSGVRTDLWTKRMDGGVHSFSRNRTAHVVLAQSGLGAIRISAITSLSHAWHDADGFHAKTSTSIGRLEFVPPTGDPRVLDLPTPGQPVEIPGVAKISVGSSVKQVSDHAGIAKADALQVVIVPSGTRLTVAHSSAQALDGIKFGEFHGYSAGSQVTAADGNLTSGRTPLSLLPCQGTDGNLRTKAIADVDLGGQVIVQGLRSQQKAQQLAGRSVAMERGSVAGLDLGGGQLVVDAVTGQANVTRTADGKVTADTDGTTLGTITANGEPQTFPDTDVLEIPGVAKLERRIVERTKFGISVVALRITLLDGTGAVIDLGVARARIR